MREGEKNGRSKMTWDLVRQMRRRYAKGKRTGRHVSMYTLALDYEINQSTVYGIIAGETWKEKGAQS